MAIVPTPTDSPTDRPAGTRLRPASTLAMSSASPSPAVPTTTLALDVWSDVVCPWCFIGLANLDAALERFDHAASVEVRLHSFQLDPSAPLRDEGPLVERLAQKYGTSVEQIRESQARIVALGAERGIDFRFDEAVGGNTFDAHRLLHLAARHHLQLDLKHRLGRAYFTDGDPIGEPDTLRRAAVDVGLDPDEIDAVLAGDAFADEVRATWTGPAPSA